MTGSGPSWCSSAIARCRCGSASRRKGTSRPGASGSRRTRWSARTIRDSGVLGAPLQLQLPGLADEGLAEAVVFLRVALHESGGFVEPASRDEHAVCPERDLPVPRLPSELDALVDEQSTDAE